MNRKRPVNQHYLAAAIILGILTACVFGGVLFAIANKYFVSAIWLTIFAIFTGLKALTYLEESLPAELPPLESYKLQLFSSTTNKGNNVNVVLEVECEGEGSEKPVIDRLETELQRVINIYLDGREGLSETPYQEIDGLIRETVEPLKKRLNLSYLSIRTVDVKAQQSQPLPQGIYLRGDQ